jgi:hypothetical protein
MGESVYWLARYTVVVRFSILKVLHVLREIMQYSIIFFKNAVRPLAIYSRPAHTQKLYICNGFRQKGCDPYCQQVHSITKNTLNIHVVIVVLSDYQCLYLLRYCAHNYELCVQRTKLSTL